MKLVKMLLTLWKYRKYDFVYCVCYTDRACDVNIPIRRVKLLGLSSSMAKIVTLDGDVFPVHRGYITDNKKDAKQIQKMCLDYEKEQWYE